MPSPAGDSLVGRTHELRVLDDLLAGLRCGRGGVLTVRGEAGIGKTMLLRHLIKRATGCTILRATGVESEMELAYAGLHQLCLPLLDRIGDLPTPQQGALRGAFGLISGSMADRFMVGLGALGLLAAAGRERPVLCVIDDAQWLDSATADTVGFIGRRLGDTPIAVVGSMRQPLVALPGDERRELVVGGLADDDARILLRSVVPGPIHDEVVQRILAEAGGNPLALLELPRGLGPEQLAGGFGLPTAGTVSGRIEQSYARRITALPAASQTLLLVVAAEPRQDAVLIWRAANRLGLAVSDAGPAVADELISFGGEVRFRHPLVRSTVYGNASPQDRRRVHQALAEATSADLDPDRRAWHLAHAASGLDEQVAAELERSAGRAQAIGGFSAAAAFWERSAGMTPDPARRAERAMRAAQLKFFAGAPERALRLLAVAEAGTGDELSAARAYLLRAQIAAATGRRTPSLLHAARRLVPLDPELADETFRDAFYAALTAGRLAPDGDRIGDVAEAIQAGHAAGRPTKVSPTAGLLDGVARVITHGYRAGAPQVQRALGELLVSPDNGESAMRWLPLASRLAHDVWDEKSWRRFADRTIVVARNTGQLRMLPNGLLSRFALALFEGRLECATGMAEECMAVRAATHHQSPPYAPLVLAAFRGREQETVAVLREWTADAQHGDGQWLTASGWANALLLNAHGRYLEALQAAEDAAGHPEELGLANWAMVELVEAAARAGLPERAHSSMLRLEEIARACGTDWASATAARCRALLLDGPRAEIEYRESIELFDRTSMRAGLARAHLVYGEWLRRENRRVDAREHLDLAHRMLSDMGADAFAERAGRELAATGATAQRGVTGPSIRLTEQEAQIARLAVAGRTNPEIARQLFISARTVEWHLRKVYSKLGVTSRKQMTPELIAQARHR